MSFPSYITNKAILSVRELDLHNAHLYVEKVTEWVSGQFSMVYFQPNSLLSKPQLSCLAWFKPLGVWITESLNNKSISKSKYMQKNTNMSCK